MFFSPGTGTISAVTLWEPVGGDALSVTWQLVDSPAVVCGTIVCPLTLVPDTVTRHFTLVSVFWPVLAKSSVNVGAGLAGIELVDPVWRVLPPTLTEFNWCPCRPGAMGALLDPDDEGRLTWSAVATCWGSSHWIEGRNWLELSCWPPSAADRYAGRAKRADDLRDGVVLVQHVRGVEARHLGRDRVDRVLARLGLERRADLVGDVAHPVLAHLERGDEVLLGPLHLVGSAQALGVAEFSGRPS